MHAGTRIQTRDLPMSNEQTDNQQKKNGEKLSEISCEKWLDEMQHEILVS